MRAMILAAGRGERMRPITDNIPKPLVQVNGKPLIVHHIHSLARHGIKEIVINTWYLGQQIIDALGDGSQFDVSLSYSQEDELLNTGGGIVKALPLLGDRPFVVISADILSDFPFNSLPNNLNSLAHLILVDNPVYHIEGDFALENGRLKNDGEEKYTYANIGVFAPDFFKDSPKGAFALGDLMREHIRNDLVTGEYYSGVWHNIGTAADLALVNNNL